MWELPLPQLPDGTYTVVWRSHSAEDGHVAKSSYTFTVASTGAAPQLGPVPMSFDGDPGSDSWAPASTPPERLRFEAYIGAVILLAASTMSQVLP